MDNGVCLSCGLLIESTEVSVTRPSRQVYKAASLTLGRDGYQEPILQVETNGRYRTYRLTQTVIHRRFLKEGRSTLDIKSEKVQLMISNCPPDKLLLFLKTMVGKIAKHKSTGMKCSRMDGLLNAPFTEISPLCEQDLICVRVPPTHDSTPNRKPTASMPTKRKHHSDENKENRVAKLTKRGLSLSSTITELTPEQCKVLDAIRGGKNVFFTGSAGTGKSFLLQRAVGSLPPEHTFITASTGIAASLVSGMTLHSFAGIGSGKGTLEQCIELANRPTVLAQWKKCHHLIVDEVSMIDGELFSKLEAVARIVRKSDMPFGGIQLILCGDFFQLPPVNKTKDKAHKFCFQTRAWRRCVDLVLQLKQVKRQTDTTFVCLLNKIRHGFCPDEATDILTATAKNELGDGQLVATKLSTHNKDVDAINAQSLSELKGDFPNVRITNCLLEGDIRQFTAVDSDCSLSRRIDDLCPAQREINLKKGAQVMIVKNISMKDRLVNGARGVITGFESASTGYPIVRFASGRYFTIKPEMYTFKWSAGLTLTRKQLPLKLAWAVSIHKSQGMTLDLVEMSLSNVFEYGQAYVALSRARSLQGLKVTDFSASCVRAHPGVQEFYKQLDQRLAGDYL